MTKALFCLHGPQNVRCVQAELSIPAICEEKAQGLGDGGKGDLCPGNGFLGEETDLQAFLAREDIGVQQFG
jgi:hypothetical protein